MVKRIIKRDGRVVDFDRDKIQSAIMKAVEAVGGDDDVEASRVTDLVVAELSKCEEEPQVEYIQDLVEKMLIEEGHAATAKEYILYRANRDRVREMNSSLMRTFEELSFGSSNDVELKRENANIDGDTAMGMMLRYGSESAKQFNLSYLVSPDIAKAHRSGDIHIHDLDFMALTETCVSGDTKVIIRDDSNGDIRVVNAEYFDRYLSGLKDSMVKELDGISIYSGGEFVRLVNCVRHRADDKRVLQIKTDYNELKVTDEHRIPVIRGEEIEVLKAKDIKVGDKLIVDSLGKSKTKTNLKSINLIDLLTNSDNIIIHNTDIILKAIKEKGHWDEFSNNVGSDNRWNGIKRGKYKMTVAEYKSAIRELNYIDESKLKLAYKRTRGMESINAELALTEELGKFIGYMLSDGSVTAHKIKGKDNIAKKACFTNKSKELICDFNRCTEVVFNNASINDRYTCGELSGTRLSGYLIYELFHGPLGVKNGAGDIELPEWVMSANMEFISGLLGGLIDGDGNVQSDGYRVSYGTASEKLAKGIRLLLLLLGIRSYIRKDSVKGTEVKDRKSVV